MPGDAVSWSLFPHEDKLLHFLAFGFLGLTFIRALTGATNWRFASCVAVTVVGVLLAGLSDELHQYFVPGRDVEALDVLADAVGGAVASLVWTVLFRPGKEGNP